MKTVQHFSLRGLHLPSVLQLQWEVPFASAHGQPMSDLGANDDAPMTEGVLSHSARTAPVVTVFIPTLLSLVNAIESLRT